MSIEFDCPSCGKHFSVSDGLAGKRAKCRWCQGPIVVPHPPAPEPADDFNDLSALESAASETSGGAYAGTAYSGGARAADGYDKNDYAYGQPVAPVAVGYGDAGPALPPAPPPFRGRGSGHAAVGTAGSLPAWAAPLLAKVGRLPGLPWQAWAAIVVVAILLLGFVSDWAALAGVVVLGGVGGLLLAVALVWGVIVGVAVGSRVIVIALVTGLVVAPFATFRSWIRSANRVSRNPNIAWSTLPTEYLIGGVAGGLAIAAILFGMVANPRAFKWPALFALTGVALLTFCWMPLVYRTSSPSSAGYATGSSGRQVTGPPSDWKPRQVVAAPIRKTVRPPVFPTPSADEPVVEPPPTPAPDKAPSAEPTPAPAVETKATEPTPVPARPTASEPPAAVVPATPPPAAAVPRPTTPPVAAPAAPAVVVPAPAWAVVNAKVQAKWGAAWYDARVVRVERGWTQVEYQSDRTHEWVEPWRTRAAGSRADDVPPTSPNATWNKPDTPAPDGPPGPRPTR